MNIFKTIQDLTRAHLRVGELVLVLENGTGDDSKLTVWVIVDSSESGQAAIANGNKARNLQITTFQP